MGVLREEEDVHDFEVGLTAGTSVLSVVGVEVDTGRETGILVVKVAVEVRMNPDREQL